jgi:hypothetical protein
MPMNFDDTAIRDQLVADVTTAWAPTKIYLDAPKIAAVSADLPVAYINVTSVPMNRGAGAATPREVNQGWTYDIVLVEKRPAAGTLHAAKVAKADALLALLTAHPVTYVSWFRNVLGVVFTEGTLDETAEEVYIVRITFRVEVISYA